MNIVISSTRQWNPGDEFIRYGVLNLLKEVIGEDHNYILWNRNPDLFCDGYSNDNMREAFYTNSAKPSDLQNIDLIVFAGTPEWLGGPVRALMDYIHANPSIPVLFIGIGAGRPLNLLTDKDKEVLKRANCLILSRSLGLAKAINNLLAVDKAIDIPCPSLFAREENLSGKRAKKIGIIIQADQSINHSIKSSLMESFLATCKTLSEEYEILCFYIDEFTYFSKLGLNCRYSFDPDDYLKWYKDYSFVLSTRLHGALPALSMGIPSLLVVSDDNTRINTTKDLITEVIEARDNFEAAIKWQKQIKQEEYIKLQENIKNFREKTRKDYISLINQLITSQPK